MFDICLIFSLNSLHQKKYIHFLLLLLLLGFFLFCLFLLFFPRIHFWQMFPSIPLFSTFVSKLILCTNNHWSVLVWVGKPYSLHKPITGQFWCEWENLILCTNQSLVSFGVNGNSMSKLQSNRFFWKRWL